MHRISLRRLLAVLALSGSPAAASAAALPHTELDADVPIDRENLDPSDAASMLGRQLAHALCGHSPLEATHIATTWALSEDPLRRLAIAHALEFPFRLVGADVVLDHLAHDPDAKVRAAVARAAWIRRPSLGTEIVDRLSADPDPEVRSIARHPGRG
jgi:PIN domain nuclease of toxin-antitoxin system